MMSGRRPTWVRPDSYYCPHGLQTVYFCARCEMEARIEEVALRFLVVLEKLEAKL
jgi:hypothetical protein